MNVLFDTDIILDVMLDREPHEIHAYKLITLVEKGHIKGCLGAGSFNILHYLLSQQLEQKWVKRHLLEVLDMFHVIPVNSIILEKAVKSNMLDFEDAILCQAAEEEGMDYIVSRNRSVAKKGKVPVFPPEELLFILESLSG